MRKIIGVLVAIILFLSLSGCGTSESSKQTSSSMQTNPVQSESTMAETKPAKDTTVASTGTEEKQNRISSKKIRVTQQQAIEYIAKIFDGNSKELEVIYNDKTKMYEVSWPNPGVGMGGSWDIDAVNGDAFDGMGDYMGNMFDSNKKSPDIYQINLKEGQKTDLLDLRIETPITIDTFKDSTKRELLDFMVGDFDGDSIDDIAYLTSDFSNDFNKDNISLIIQNGSDNNFKKSNENYFGEFANLQKAKATSKNKYNLIMHISYGGNGGAGQHAYYLITYNEDNIRNEFCFDAMSDSNPIGFTVTFLDNYLINDPALI